MDVRLPNGILIRGVPEGTTQEKLRRIAIKNNIAKPEDFAESGILPALQGGFESLVSSGQTALESLTGSPKEASLAGLKRQEDIRSRLAPGADFSKVSEKLEKEGLGAAAGEVLRQIPTAAAEMAPAIVAGLASGAAGFAVAGPVGGLAGAFLPSLVTRAGTDIEQQAAADLAEKKPVDINRTAAFGLAVPGAALDVAANTIPVLGRTAVAKLFPAAAKALNRGAVETAERIAKESLIKRASKGTLENLAIQGAVQPAQVMLTRIQAGQDLLSPEAINEYGHAMYMAGLLSPIGAVGGIRERGQAREQIEQRNAMLDAARQKLFEASEAAKPTPDAPDLPMSALNIQRLLGVKLTEAGAIRKELYKRGDLVGGTGGGKYVKLFLNRERLPKAEEPVPPVSETTPTPTEESKAPGFTSEQLLGPLVERTPEELAADQAVVPPSVTPPGEVLPVVRKRGEKKPAAEKITSPENPVFQAGAKLVKEMDEAGTPITPETFGTALNSIIGETPKRQIGSLLGALTRNNLLSKPDENRVRTYVPPVEVTPFKAAEVENAEPTGRTEAVDAESTGRGVETPVSGDEAAVAATQRNIERGVEDVGESAAIRATPERRGEPALGEPVPYSAQPIAPDVFVPTPEQAKLGVKVEEVTPPYTKKLPSQFGRVQERPVEEVIAKPEEGVSQRYDSVAESLRAGNLGEALYRLREESSGKSPLSWLADRLLNVVEVKDDRTPIISAEVERIARERGINKEETPALHELLTQEVERAVMSDVDLTRYKYNYPEFKPEVARKVEDIPTQPLAPPQKPFTLDDLPKPVSPFKKGAFGGAKVFVEGNADVKGQNKAVIDRLQREGKLAEYNPKTNTFYFTEAGLTDRVILHEMTHSASVGVMKTFLSGKAKELTDTQRQGAKEIVDIYNDTKATLGDKFKNAYENEYEFITHATTHEGFQRALSNISAPKTAREKLRSAWNSFTIAVAKMVGLDRFARQAKPSSERIRAADTLDNALLTAIESVSDILTVPRAGVEVEPLAARQSRRTQPKRLRAPTTPQYTTGNTKDVFINNKKPSAIARAWDVVKKGDLPEVVNKGYENFAFLFQNHLRPWLKQQEYLNKSKLTRRINNINNTNDLMTLAMGKKDVIDLQRVTPLINRLQVAIGKYANKVGITMAEAGERLGVYRMALNEAEKRMTKYLAYVPLDDAPILNIGGTSISPAAYRDALIAMAADKRLTATENARIRQQLETLASRYAKQGGRSWKDRVPANAADALDINSNHYQVIGYHPTDLKMWRRSYQREQRANQAEIREVFDAIDAINEEHINLDRQGNYWTPQVDNFRQIYNYKYYVPYKGIDKSGTDIGFDLDTMARSGAQFRQLADKAEGRSTGIENPLYQSIQDLHQAASRAARAGITESIKNQIKDGDLEGKLVDTVSFLDRHEGTKTRADLTGKNIFFHHVGDGTIEVYSLKDPKLVEGLNGFYSDVGMVTRTLAYLTHGMGRMHTFYNPAFAPVNFIRDALTNSYAVGAQFGPVATVKVIGSVAKNIVTSRGMSQAAKISALYQKGDMAGIAAMRGKFAKEAYEYLVEQGGRGSFQQSYDLSTIEKKVLNTPGHWVVDKGKAAKGAVDTVATVWADTFEIASRVGAYSTVKKELIAEAKARGINTNSPDFIEGLKQEAAAFTKNAFNYEQTGKYGREVGAWYMFLRPSLTSAVRAIDAIKPAFENVEAAIARGPKSLKITDPSDPNFARSEAARAEFRKQHAKEKRNAMIIAGILGALGYQAYGMSLSAAGTDLQGRNKVATDDMSMWTRAWRYPMQLAGEGNEFFQMSWGFGLGAFAAMGAQLASWINGNQSSKDMFINMLPISLDSFVPLPSPRYSPTEYPLEFMFNSIVPSPLAPIFQHMINLDGLGREIQSERVSKLGEAFSGRETVSKWARDATKFMTNFAVEHGLPVKQLNPALLEHYMNNYLDGVGKFINAVYGMANMVTSDRPFDAKKDIPVFSGFIGKASNIDAKEFAELRDIMEEKAGLLSALENHSQDLYDKYTLDHPNDVTMVNLYNTTINGELKKLQEEARKITAGVGAYADTSERVKLQMLKDNREIQNIYKYNFVQSIRALQEQKEQE